MSMYIDFCFLCDRKQNDLLLSACDILQMNGWSFNTTSPGEYLYYKDASMRNLVSYKVERCGEKCLNEIISDISQYYLPTLYMQRNMGEYKNLSVISVSEFDNSQLKEVEVSFENGIIYNFDDNARKENKILLENIFYKLIKELYPVYAVSGTEIDGVKIDPEDIISASQRGADLSFFSKPIVEKYNIEFSDLGNATVTDDNYVGGIIIKNKNKLFEL